LEKKNCVGSDFFFQFPKKNPNKKGEKSGLFSTFIDIRKAYDRVWRSGLWTRLYEEGVRGKMARVLKNMYLKVESCVLVHNDLSRWFTYDVGLRQGCVLSCVLFSIFMNGLSRMLNNSNDLKVAYGSQIFINHLLYADDLVLFATNTTSYNFLWIL